MSSFNMSELGVFVGICSSALVAVLIATQKSKCSNIGCCGCVVERDVSAVIAEEKLQMTGSTGLTPKPKEKEIKLEITPEAPGDAPEPK